MFEGLGTAVFSKLSPELISVAGEDVSEVRVAVEVLSLLIGAAVGHVALVQLHGGVVDSVAMSECVVGTVGLVHVAGVGAGRHVREPTISHDCLELIKII